MTAYLHRNNEPPRSYALSGVQAFPKEITLLLFSQLISLSILVSHAVKIQLELCASWAPKVREDKFADLRTVAK